LESGAPRFDAALRARFSGVGNVRERCPIIAVLVEKESLEVSMVVHSSIAREGREEPGSGVSRVIDEW